jgi:hypothetical protein
MKPPASQPATCGPLFLQLLGLCSEAAQKLVGAMTKAIYIFTPAEVYSSRGVLDPHMSMPPHTGWDELHDTTRLASCTTRMGSSMPLTPTAPGCSGEHWSAPLPHL